MSDQVLIDRIAALRAALEEIEWWACESRSDGKCRSCIAGGALSDDDKARIYARESEVDR